MKCENCSTEISGEYGSGRFCSVKCARSFSTKKDRAKISKKISKANKKNKPKVELVCGQCGKQFYRNFNKRYVRFCSRKCGAIYSHNDPAYAVQQSASHKKNFTTLASRQRMRDIGRKGGFGTKSVTSNGVRCDSNFERKAFDLLEQLKIEFEPHKSLPDSAKMCDAYLPLQNIWIELDGINREKHKHLQLAEYPRWIAKLEEYRINNLHVEVFTSMVDFEKFICPLS